LEEDDDLIDRLIEHHPGFGKLLERRLRERTVSIDTVARKLAAAAPKGAHHPQAQRLEFRIVRPLPGYCFLR
jgi:hypothetical protein